MWNVLLCIWHIRSSCHKLLCIPAKSNNPELPYLCTALMHMLPLSFQAIITRHMMCFSQRPQTLHKWNREIDQMCQLDFLFELVMRKIWPKAADAVNQRSVLRSVGISLAPEFLKDCRHIFPSTLANDHLWFRVLHWSTKVSCGYKAPAMILCIYMTAGRMVTT